MTASFLEVTDLKQYTYCPRIVFYRYCLPAIRPMTFLMEEGQRQHEQEEQREDRRSFQKYGLEQGDRFYHLLLRSEKLGLVGQVDLVIATPSRSAPEAKAVIVEYKYSEQKAGPHFRLQLAAYALLVEELWHIPVLSGYIYAIPTRQVESVPITAHLRKKVIQTYQHIRMMVASEILPPLPAQQHRCPTCEFRRFCNDVV